MHKLKREHLAIVFACQHHGRESVQVETDHILLVPIMQKPLINAPSWLQRMLLILQKYNV